MLDLGCGVGHVLRILPQRLRCFGVDYSPASLRLASRGLRTASLAASSAYQLPFRQSSFDAVICLEVLEHLERDDEAVAEIARVLKPGGRLVTSVPSTYYFPEYRDLMGHYRHYTPQTFAGLLARHGLAVDRFLNDYPRFNKMYFYVYATAEACNRMWNRITGGRTSIYARTLPWTTMRLYSGLLAPVLLPLRRLDENRRARPTTFLVAQKQIGAEN